MNFEKPKYSSATSALPIAWRYILKPMKMKAMVKRTILKNVNRFEAIILRVLFSFGSVGVF